MEEAPRRKRSLGRALLAALIAIVIVIGGRWCAYVAYADDPFDEVGIDLNSMMPAPFRDKGCEMLRARFEHRTLPPAGCGVNGNW